MTSEQIVRTRYPDAYAKYRAPGLETGQSGPSTQASWVIAAGTGAGNDLGTGGNEQAAWQAAAEKVKVDTCIAKTQLWVNYLLAHGYRRNPENENELLNERDPELVARIIPRTGTLHLSPRLAEQLATLADSDGNPPQLRE